MSRLIPLARVCRIVHKIVKPAEITWSYGAGSYEAAYAQIDCLSTLEQGYEETVWQVIETLN